MRVGPCESIDGSIGNNFGKWSLVVLFGTSQMVVFDAIKKQLPSLPHSLMVWNDFKFRDCYEKDAMLDVVRGNKNELYVYVNPHWINLLWGLKMVHCDCVSPLQQSIYGFTLSPSWRKAHSNKPYFPILSIEKDRGMSFSLSLLNQDSDRVIKSIYQVDISCFQEYACTFYM